MGWPIPNIQQMLRRLGSHKPTIFGKLDFTSGYHQAPLAKVSRIFTAFITHMGVYMWNRVPMGLKGAGAYFQGVLASTVLAGLIYITCELYIDDLIIHATNEKDFLSRLDAVLARLKKHKIRVHPDKCLLGLDEVEYVGHTINSKGLSFSREKIDKRRALSHTRQPQSLVTHPKLKGDESQIHLALQPLLFRMRQSTRRSLTLWTTLSCDVFFLLTIC